MISHCDFAFAVWNTLTSPELQTTNNVEKESSGDESNETCFMVQGNDSLEVNSDTQLDDNASVGCLKITEDKSSKSRIQTSDARLIIATSASPKREG